MKCIQVHLKELYCALPNEQQKKEKKLPANRRVVQIKAAKLPQWEDVQNFHFQDDWTTGSSARRPTEGSLLKMKTEEQR